MRIRYLELDHDRLARAIDLEKLRRFFLELILVADGDVEAAYDHMEGIWGRYGLDQLMSFEEWKEWLEEQRLVARDRQTGRSRLTALGERTIRKEALSAIFGNLVKSEIGEHPTPRTGRQGERLAETRPWRFGDPTEDIDFGASIKNALRRTHGEGLATPGLHIAEDDLEVFETEHLSSCATVLLLDISHSMTLYGEDRITPAKRVALALVELIRTQFPKDSVDVAVFGDEAWPVTVASLPYLSNGPFHTNTRAGLQLAQRLLARRKHPNKQIFMITDGKPSCMDIDGEHYQNSFGLDPAIVARTLDEAAACRKKRIVISTFMVARDPYLVEFVESLTRVNRGRAFFSDPRDVGSTILVDFLRNRRRRVR